MKIGVLTLISFRPFPHDAIREVLKKAKRVVVVEKDLAVGVGGIVSHNLSSAVEGMNLPIFTVIAGLGGRSITRNSLKDLFQKAHKDQLDSLTFLDLNHDIVEKELERERNIRRSGPVAENMLRDVGTVAAGVD
jgi:pyruvate ferredoxin oxidoreductase alpha subunit